MKKSGLIFLLVMVSLIPILPLFARADVLIEPNNSFYERHRKECTHLGRSFYANGEDGYAALKREPGSKTETAVIENGDTIHIMFTYEHKGELWGVAEISSLDTPYREWPNGWVSMNQLLLVYDYISFEEEHKDEIYDYAGGDETLKKAKELIIWTWPGSGDMYSAQGPGTPAYSGPIEISSAYKDSERREWGFLSYWYGHRNAWVCLSDPENSEIPAFNPAPEPELWPQADNLPAPNKGLSTPLLIVILVAVLIIGTVILVRVFWKPKKEKQ